MDNLSNGYYTSLEGFVGLLYFEFLESNIRDFETCRKAVAGMGYISHKAALGSVLKSVEDPVTSNDVNIGGHLNVLAGTKESPTLKRMVMRPVLRALGIAKRFLR